MPGCGRDAEYVGFAAYEVLLREGQTIEGLLKTATHSSNAKAPEARNIIVRCKVHGKKIVQIIGNHITGSKARRARR